MKIVENQNEKAFLK